METEYRNNFTKFLDLYRINKITELEPPYNEMMSTYLWYPDIVNNDYEDGVKHIAFRLPGATRGHITVDKQYVIKDILFYGDTCFNTKHNGIECYKTEVVTDATKKFRDTVLDIHNGIVGDDYLYGEVSRSEKDL